MMIFSLHDFLNIRKGLLHMSLFHCIFTSNKCEILWKLNHSDDSALLHCELRGRNSNCDDDRSSFN